MKDSLEKLGRLAYISRPISWVNTAYPFTAGYLVAGGRDWLVLAIATLYFLIPYNLLMYGVNDVFDYESDIRNPRKGGIEGAQAAKAFHPTILWAAVLSNLPFLVVLLLLGSAWSAFVLAVVVFFVLAYSLPVLRFKERPILDSITSSLHFVGPLLFGLALLDKIPDAWPFIVAFFLWGMASHAFGAIQDIVPDREGDLASIATVLGARNTLRFVLVCYVLSAGLLVVQGVAGIVVAATEVLYVANALPYWRVTDATSGATNRGWRRFIWLNYFSGFVITLVLLIKTL